MDEATLRAWAAQAGFAQSALCSAAEFAQARRVVDGQPPLAERRQLRFDPCGDDSRVKSLLVLLRPYAPAAPAQGGTVFVDSYYFASNAAYHAARALEARLTQAGCYARANVPYPAKEAAVRAGLGVMGQNSLLITPEYGTRVVILLMATDVEVTRVDAPVRADCLRCGRCAAACTSGALSAQGMCHPERCLRNFMMEGLVVPEALREAIGMRLIGCDICQRVCPMQPACAPARQEALRLDAFVTDDPAAFSSAVARLGEQIGRNAARPQRVRAQAALLAGNSGNPAYLPVLRAWAQSPFEAVREHARWAIDRLQTAGGA